MAAFAIAAGASGLAGAETLNLLALAAILAIGVPHGALDVALSWKLGLLATPRKSLAALMIYLALIAAVIAAWLTTPLATFGAFLLMSALHFGADREIADLESGVLKLAIGSLPISLPAVFHPVEYAALIVPLVGDEAALATRATGVAGVAALATIVCAAAFRTGAERKLPFIGLLTLSAALLDPLVSFAIYFVFLHSMQHYREHWPDYRQRPGRTLASVAICAALFLAVFATLHQFAPVFEGAPTAALLFLLSAVSLPHSLLVAYASLRRGAPRQVA